MIEEKFRVELLIFCSLAPKYSLSYIYKGIFGDFLDDLCPKSALPTLLLRSAEQDICTMLIEGFEQSHQLDEMTGK